jgi:hypothetical protein
MSTTTRVLAALIGLGVLAVEPSPQAAPKYSEWSTPVSLGATMNSAWDDALPTMSKDGLALYFTSNRPRGAGGYDIWVSQRADVTASWGTPMNLGPVVNTLAFEAGPALSRDGHWLFFHSTGPGGLGGFDLMASWRQHTHDDFGWQTPVNLGPVVNSPFNDAGPSYLEGDERGTAELFFGSTRPGGFGSWDIYVSELSGDGTFGPAMLVLELSSSSADQRPAISHDGLEIFFHSDRPGSQGGNDIWVSTRPTVFDAWTTPTGLDVVNTPFSETQPTVSSDGKTLIFTSNRPGGEGMTDLYVATRTKVGGKQ